MKMNIRIFISLVLILISTFNAEASPVLSSHVYQVLAAECPAKPRERAQTGFRAEGIQGIVTALHGVAGCKAISAIPSDEGPVFTNLRVIQTDVERDVAILGSDIISREPAIGLPISKKVPSKDLSTIGHPKGLSMQLASQLRLRPQPRRPLRELLPPQLFSAVNERKSPDVDVHVLSLEGSLTSGHSGAPILDTTGSVVGVANGGLDDGGTEITWAAPWQDLRLKKIAEVEEALIRVAALPANLVFSYTAEPMSMPGELELIVSGVEAESRSWWGRTPDREIKYRTSRDGGEVRIHPDVPYLKTLASGDTLSELSYNWTAFRGELPALDVKVVNNTEKTSFLYRAVLEVVESRPDPWPVLLVIADAYRSNAGHLLIKNDGWGAASNVEFRLRFQGEDGDGWTHSMRLKELDGSTNLDLRPMLKAAGADMDALEQLRPGRSTYGGGYESHTLYSKDGRKETISGKELKRRIKNALGPFDSTIVLVTGELEYDAPTASGQTVRHTVGVKAHISLYNQNLAGVPAPPTWEYNAWLRTEGSDYNVEVPISHYVKTGEVDRFIINIGMAQSAHHQFRLRLYYNNDKSVVSGPILLEGFLPRTYVKYLSEATETKVSGKRGGRKKY